MKVVQFLIENKIKFIPIHLCKKNDENKLTLETPYKINSYQKFNDYTFDEIMKINEKYISNEKYESIAIDTHQYNIIDIDKNIFMNSDEYKQLRIDLLKSSYYLSRNKRLPHIFIKINNNECEQFRKELIFGDLLIGQWAFINKDEILQNNSIIKEIDFKDIKKLFKCRESPSINITQNDNNIDELKTKLDKLNIIRSDNFNDWICILTIIKSINKNDYKNGLSIADYFSKKSKKYKGYDDVKKHYDSIKIKNNNNEYKNLEDLIKYDNNECYTYEKLKEEFEKNNFKLWDSNSFIELKDGYYNTRSERELIQIYKNYKKYIEINDNKTKEKIFINKWLSDEKIRTYDKIDCLFTMKTNENIFNTFDGFYASKIKYENNNNDNLSIILKHIKYLANGTDEGFNYVINWLAFLIKFTDIKHMMTALCFIGSQGTGKSKVWTWICKKIIGMTYCSFVTNELSFFDKHSEMRRNKSLILFNDMNMNFIKNYTEELKSYITDLYDICNPKQQKMIQCYNMNHFVFLSNKENPLKIEVSDRRYCVFQVPDMTNEEKEINLKLLDDATNDDNCAYEFYNYLLKVDVKENFNFELTRPKNDCYINMKQDSLPYAIRFLIDNIYDFKTMENKIIDKDDDIIKFESKLFFNMFMEYCKESNYIDKSGKQSFKHIICNIPTFNKHSLDKFNNLKKQHIQENKKIYIYKFSYNELKKWLIENKHISDDEEFYF
jgi:hypothetical protein